MNRYARLVTIISAMVCACAAAPVLADHHTEAECREGGEFIRNAALARDEADERLLMEHARHVFDRPADPVLHEEEFLRACQPRI